MHCMRVCTLSIWRCKHARFCVAFVMYKFPCVKISLIHSSLISVYRRWLVTFDSAVAQQGLIVRQLLTEPKQQAL